MRLKAVLLRQTRAIVADGHGQEVELNVRITHTGAAADESAALEVIARAKTAFRHDPPHTDQRAPPRTHVAVERHGLFGCDLEIELQMILQILPDPRHIPHERNTEISELFGWSDTRELQKLR